MTEAAVVTASTERPVPKGWRWVRLGTVIIGSQPGFASGDRDPQGTVQIRMNNVDTDGSWVWDQLTRVPTNSDTVRRFRIEAGDVLFNNTNSTELVGKSAVFTAFSEPVVYSNHFTRLRVQPSELDSRFLGSWLRLLWKERFFERICNRWIGQSAVKADKLLNLEIPLPPVTEQRRISDLLENSFGAIQRMQAAAEAQLETVTVLAARCISAAFGSQMNCEWEVRTIGDQLKDGTLIAHQDGNHGEFYPRASEFVQSGVRFITAKQLLADGRIDFQSAPCLTPARAQELRIGHGLGQDVLLAHNATVGRVGIVPPNCPQFVIGTSVTAFRPDHSRLDPLFLFFALQAPRFQQQLIDFMKQSTRNQVPITRQRELSLPVPPISEQRTLATRLMKQTAHTHAMKITVAEQLEAIRLLSAAVLRRAFNGEL
jgi:type I restriction enzyme S subunit